MIFIEWNDNAGVVSGSAQVLDVSGTPPGLKPKSSTIEVAGSLTNSTVTLSFNSGVSVFGQFSGGGFTIDFPQPDGTLAPVTFRAASAAAYNLAVNGLDKQVASTNQAAAAEKTLRQQEQAIANQAAVVAGDISGLPHTESSLATDVQNVEPALQQETNDLATTQSKEQAVAAEAQQTPNNGQVCSDAGTVWDDAGTVWDDAGTVTDKTSTVENDLSSLRNAISGLQSDFAQLASDKGKLPTYQPPNLPTQAEVSQAIAAANAGISSALSTTNGEISQANAEVATAYRYTAEAYQAGNCGTPPNPPSPQQQIS